MKFKITEQLLQNKLFAPLLYFLVSSIFFYPVYFGKASIFIDQLLHIGPMFQFWKDEIFLGRLPLWNPQSLVGMPFFADSAHPVFSPFNLLFLIIPNIFTSIAIQELLFVAVSAYGAHWLSRTLKLSQTASLLAGLAYGFSGSVMEVAATDINSLIGVMLLPWVLGVYVNEVHNKKQYFSWKLAFIIALHLISSHTQYTYYALGIIFLSHFLQFIFNRAKSKDYFRNTIQFLLTVVVAFLIAAVQLVPSVELLSQTSRQENIGYENLTGILPLEFPRLLFAKIYGSIVEGNSWGPGSDLETGYANVNGFITISSLIISIISFRNIKNRCKWFLLGISVVSLILSFGNLTPVFKLFYDYVPGFSFFRSVSRTLILYSLALALLSAYGLDSLIRQKTKSLLGLNTYVVILVALTLLIVLRIGNPHLFTTMISFAYQTLKDKSIYDQGAYSMSKLDGISTILYDSATYLMIGLLGALSFMLYCSKKSIYYLVIGLSFIVFELFLTVRGDLFFVPTNIIHKETAAITYLKNNTSNGQRLVSTGDTQPYIGFWNYFNHLIVRPPFSKNSITNEELKTWDGLSKELSMIPANTHQLYGLHAVASYVAIMPRRYRTFWNSTRVNSLDFKDYSNSRFNDASVKYFVTGVPDDVLQDDRTGRFEKVFEEGKIKIYENKTVKPRSELLSYGNISIGEGKINDINNETVEISIEATKAGTLVLRDFYYPGWVAYVDGKEQEIKPYDTLFRSVDLEPGQHLVRFEYKPLSFRVGAAISIVSLAGLLGYILVSRRKYENS